MTCKFPFHRSGQTVFHVFHDESGDMTYSPSGTRFYVFTALWSYNPECIVGDLTNLHVELKRSHSSLVRLHAHENPNQVKHAIIERLSQHNCCKAASIVVRKNRLNPALYEPTQFYPQFVGYLFKFIAKGERVRRYTHMQIVTDTPPTARIRGALRGSLETTVTKFLRAGATFDVVDMPSQTNKALEAADYCGWAVKRKWTHGDHHWIDKIKHYFEKSELDIFQYGDTDYY